MGTGLRPGEADLAVRKFRPQVERDLLAFQLHR